MDDLGSERSSATSGSLPNKASSMMFLQFQSELYSSFKKRHQKMVLVCYSRVPIRRQFGMLLLLDPMPFPKSEPCLIIGSVCQIGALLGTSL